MNDTFYEQYLNATNSGKAAVQKALAIAGTIFACILCFLFFGLFFVLPVCAILFMVVYFIKPRLHKEYEYALSNFIFDVAVIYNKESRKELIEFDIREAEILAPASSPRLGGFRPVKTLDFSSGSKQAAAYAFMISINKNLHKVIIEPDETMLQLLKGRMGSRIYMD